MTVCLAILGLSPGVDLWEAFAQEIRAEAPASSVGVDAVVQALGPLQFGVTPAGVLANPSAGGVLRAPGGVAPLAPGAAAFASSRVLHPPSAPISSLTASKNGFNSSPAPSPGTAAARPISAPGVAAALGAFRLPSALARPAGIGPEETDGEAIPATPMSEERQAPGSRGDNLEAAPEPDRPEGFDAALGDRSEAARRSGFPTRRFSSGLIRRIWSAVSGWNAGSARASVPDRPAAAGPFSAAADPGAASASGAHVHEDFLGFRSVRGLRRDGALSPLPADADTPRVLEQISKQFGIPMPQIVELAGRYHLPVDGRREAWLAVYDRLQRANAAEFAHLDHKKYQNGAFAEALARARHAAFGRGTAALPVMGSSALGRALARKPEAASFRTLRGGTYADGWGGLARRALEIHKHVMGLVVRLPYHLFDMFIFGYFRRNISFEFRHSGEDFLSVSQPGSAAKWLEAAMSVQSFRTPGGLRERILASRSGRFLRRWVLVALLEPAFQFLTRRFTMAVFSAVAMGMLAPLAPFAFMSFSLTALPVVGQGIVLAAHGLPMLAAGLPYVGPALSHVLGAALNALVADLVVGPMLNTLALSTILTYPAALKQRLMENRRGAVKLPSFLSPEFWREAGRTFASGSFWRQNASSFVGLMTVGAEIQGIMTYADAIDGAFNPAYQLAAPAWARAHLGTDFKVFHAIGAAVERPREWKDDHGIVHKNLVPFGGAITWGNVLLYKLQIAAHFNVTDFVADHVNGVIDILHPNRVSRGMQLMHSSDPGVSAAAAVFHAAASAKPNPDLEFQYSKNKGEMKARLDKALKESGDIPQEIRKSKERVAELRAQLSGRNEELARLKAQSRPVTPEERAAFEKALRDLGEKRDENYIDSKLAQMHDLRNPLPDEAARLQELKKLQDQYNAVLLPPGEKPGRQDSVAGRVASLKSIEDALQAYVGGSREPRARLGTAYRVDGETQKRIAKLVTEIEALRLEAKGDLVTRDATGKLLSAVNTARNAALRERRSGKDMLEFQKGLSKLATVMDLSLSLNEIGAAEAAIAGMEQMLNNKLQQIQAANQAAQLGQSQAQQNSQQIGQWQQEVQNNVNSDQAQKSDMSKYAAQSGAAVKDIGAFRNDVGALFARINAEDSGQSSNALAEYQRRLALLPQILQWRTSGKPGDPTYTSIAGLNDDLAFAQSIVSKIDAGASKLDGAAQEFAGPVILAVPGLPDYNVHNPTTADYLGILAARKTYWHDRLSYYQSQLDEANRRLDPNYGANETDDFGDSNPYSLPRWLALEQGLIQKSQSDLATIAPMIDQLAASIRQAATSADLPTLSGLDLTGLQNVMLAYPDKLAAVTFPPETGQNSDALFQAKMNLLTLGKMLPYAARDVVVWSHADVEARTVRKSLTVTVPAIQASLAQVTAAIQAMLSDVDADVAYINSGDYSLSKNQRVIDRKKALLPQLRSAAAGAVTMLQNDYIPHVQETIQTNSPAGTGYARLFNAEITLYNATQKALNHTLPWALASQGATDGDVNGALAGIQAKQQTYQRFLTGYTDSAGVQHEGITQYAQDIQHRTDPNYAGTETLYGESQPYSLPRKISQYGAEKVQRARQFDSDVGQINQILVQLDQLTGSRYGLQAKFTLPSNIDGTSPGSIAAMQALADNQTLQNLGSALTQIAADYGGGSAGSVNIGGGGNQTTIPIGVQPSPTVDANTKIALMALQAARRLVPSSAQTPESASTSYALARYLFADGIVQAAQTALDSQIPQANAFLAQGTKAINDAVADLGRSRAYVQSGGTSETPDGVVDRELAIYGELNAFTAAGAAFFDLKTSWDQAGNATISQVQNYYNSLNSIYQNGASVDAKETQAINTMLQALKTTYDGLETNRRKFAAWVSQLNPQDQSALKTIALNIRDLQDQTRAVLEQNVQYHDVEDQHKRAEEVLQYTVRRIDERQKELQGLLGGLADPESLPPELARRIDALRERGGSWMMTGDSKDATQALVVKKSEFPNFVEQFFTMFQHQNPGQDVSAIQRQILANPQSLASLIPGSKVVDFGDNADGFYLVYQTQFGVPHGLETSTWVTLGNLAKVWGNNVSVTGYQFASPANEENAPYGDKGVEVQVESLQGSNWVNYLNVDLHRFIQDIPPDAQMASSARESRLLVFDDFAMLLFGDRLYVALTGFGDWALADRKDKPSYYGDSFKTSIKFTEVMRLNAEQQQVFAKDPRWFMETVNLDFTGLDPALNQTFPIFANNPEKTYVRRQIGPSFDLAKALGSQDAFTLDFYFARQEGTDDYTQNLGGVSILKGFSLRDDAGKPWMTITNRATAEKGQLQNQYADRVSVSLPNQGIVFNAQGGLIGDAKTYYADVEKRMGDHSALSLSYGRQYPGLNNRLMISMNSAFTLGEMWRSVAEQSAEKLAGGEALKGFNQDLDAFFNSEAPNSRTVADLKAVYMQDVGRKLLSQDVGTLAKEIAELRGAGAFLDNTRVRGMVGFVSSPVSNAFADRTVGGGFAAGTNTELTLTKTQKSLIDAKLQSLYAESMRLEARMFELTEAWQAAVEEIAEAQWELKLAGFTAANAPNDEVRKEGEVELARARARYDRALVRYNMLAGRNPDDSPPFENLNAEDLQTLIGELKKTLASPERLSEIFASLSPEETRVRMGANPFNLADWFPFIDRFTFSVGTQLQDMMSNQLLGIGGSVRIPIYDPSSKERDHAYRFDAAATLEEMKAVQQEYDMRVSQEAAQAAYWNVSGENLLPRARQAASELADAIPAYRNGLVPESRLREAFAQWRWYVDTALKSEGQEALAEAWAGQAAVLARHPAGSEPLALRSAADALTAASANSRALQEMAYREEAAAAVGRAEAHRIEEAHLDLHIGVNVTADGVGWLPSFGVTGVPITPVLGFELKPDELVLLQKQKNEGDVRLYGQLKAKVELGLAAQFYEDVVTAKTSEEARRLLETERIPELRAALAQANASGDAAAAARDRLLLDQAEDRANQYWLSDQRALQTLNYILGRTPDAPLRLDLSPEEALSGLQAVLAARSPVETERTILDSRVQVARAVEGIVDKNLKIEELRLEPVSIVVRTLGRLVTALSQDEFANPDKAAAARVQTLEAERERDGFDRDLAQRRSVAESGLDLARAKMNDLRGKLDPESRIQYVEWEQKALLLEANLAEMGAPEGVPAGGAAGGGRDIPISYSELADRLRTAYQQQAPPKEQAPLEAFDPDLLTHQSAAYARYYYAHEDLVKNPLDRGFLEGWVEVRLRSRDTPPEVLLALAKLRTEKEDRLRKNAELTLGGDGDALAAQFAANVRLLRWAESAAAAPGASRRSLDAFVLGLRDRLNAQKERIVALLGLPVGTPLEELARLVPEAPGGDAAGPAEMAGRFISDVRALNVDKLRRQIFEGGIPESFGDEDNLMHQIKADVIAERMSYKGFTPLAAFGVFRGSKIGAGFLEAPDPRSIEASLVDVVSDSLRKELESQGRMHELALRLNLLMRGVQDDAALLGRQALLVSAAQDAYRAAAAAQEAGTGGAGDLLSAQDALAAAWSDFDRTAADMKGDFIDLVTELEALGYGDKGGPSASGAAASGAPAPDAEGLPRPADGDVLAGYLSRRMLDEGFAARMDYVLTQLEKDGAAGGGIDLRERLALRQAAATYRLMDEDAGYVRNMDFSTAEKLGLLTGADVEGRRQKVADLLRPVVEALRTGPSSGPGKAMLLQFVREDLTARRGAAEASLADENRLLAEMRDAWWRAVPASPAVQGAFQRLSAKEDALVEARQALLDDYMMRLMGPSEFVMRDIALDGYLKAQEEFDKELIATYASEEVKADAALAQDFDALFDFRAALSRETDRARFGGGMAAIDALVMLEEGRLAAQRYDRALPAQMREAAVALQRLRDLRDQWRSDPRGLVPLYAVTETDGQGRRLWTIQGWHTGAEIASMKQSGQIKTDAQGRMWLAGRAAGKVLEVVSGVDVAESGRDAARSAALDNQRTVDLFKTLEAHDFALVPLTGGMTPDGAPSGEPAGIDYDRMMQLGNDGRLFYFSREADGSGLNPSIHPVEALWKDPAKAEVFAYTGRRALSRDLFPTRQGLDDYLARLASSQNADDRAEAASWARLEAGERGVRAMIGAAQDHRLSLLRAGWMNLKLTSYGFAMDDRGLVDVYLTQDEFDKAERAFKDAPRDLADARARLQESQANLPKAEAAMKARRQEAEAGRIGLQKVKGDVAGDLEPAARRDLGLPAQGDLGPKAAAAVDAKVQERLILDSRFKDAQKASAEKEAAFDKENQKYVDAQRRVDQAKDDIASAEKRISDAKTWRMFKTEDLGLSLDAHQALVGVAAKPDFGAGDLREALGAADGPVSVVRGEIYAAEIDGGERLVRIFQDEGQMEKAAKGWTLQDVDGRRWTAGGKTVDPNFRLLHYVDPSAGPVNEKTRAPAGAAVLLNRRYMIDRLADANSHLSVAKHWGLMPWNWGNLLLEVPRDVIKTPLELMDGRDPNEQGYLGRVYLEKGEGGETEHHGFFRRALGTLDILELFPDPVERFYDPSQFPAEVQLSSRLKPGENVFDKGARAVDGGKQRDVHFGEGAIARAVTYETEDLLNAKRHVFTYFDGGASTAWIETRRGRGVDPATGRSRTYESSTVDERSGTDAIVDALKDPRVAANPGSDGRGTVEVSGDPQHLEVDRVVKQVTVRPGAKQEEAAIRNLQGYEAALDARRMSADATHDALQRDAESAEGALRDAVRDRDRVAEAERGLWDEVHRLAWRIAEQETLEARIKALEDEIARIAVRLADEQGYLEWLEGLLQHPPAPPPPSGPGAPGNPGGPGTPAGPGTPGNPSPGGPGTPSRPGQPSHPSDAVWGWVFLGAALAALAAFLRELRRRRRNRPV